MCTLPQRFFNFSLLFLYFPFLLIPSCFTKGFVWKRHCKRKGRYIFFRNCPLGNDSSTISFQGIILIQKKPQILRSLFCFKAHFFCFFIENKTSPITCHKCRSQQREAPHSIPGHAFLVQNCSRKSMVSRSDVTRLRGVTFITFGFWSGGQFGRKRKLWGIGEKECG